MSTYDRMYAVVRRIPSGRVATYGQIALEAGLAGHARQAGYAMAALPYDTDVPWHRVVNARGEVSRRSAGTAGERIQRMLLEAEGVVFAPTGRINFEHYRWES